MEAAECGGSLLGNLKQTSRTISPEPIFATSQGAAVENQRADERITQIGHCTQHQERRQDKRVVLGLRSDSKTSVCRSAV